MAFGGDIFIKDLSPETEMLIEGVCWSLNCAIFSSLSGDLHHGSAQYLIEGVRIALTKYGYETKLRIFRDKDFAELLNYQLLTLGFITRGGDYKKDFEHIDKRLLKYLPKIKEDYITKDDIGIKIPYSFKKLGNLYFVLDFLTRVNSIMSRMEADPIGTFMFNALKDFKKYITKLFEKLVPEDFIDYEEIFIKFLNEKGNEKIKETLQNYQYAKIVSYLDIETMLRIGENDQIEFKEEVVEGIINDAIAFSNTRGGKIIIGISDKKEVIGVEDYEKKSKQVLDLIIGNTNPKINPMITSQIFMGEIIIIIEIFPYEEMVMNHENKCYVRKGDKNLLASGPELRKLLEKGKKLDIISANQEGFSLDIIKNKIINSEINEWIFDDEKGIYTFSKDVNLRIIRDDSGERQEFQEPWVNLFPDPKGYKVLFEIFYGSSFIEKIYTVMVDGGRCYIPYPELKDMKITNYRYQIGKIINKVNGVFGSFDSYLKRGGIKTS